MSPNNQIETDSVVRENIVKDVQAELFNEEKFYSEKKVYASCVRDYSSSLSKRLASKSIKTTEEFLMDYDTEPFSPWPTPSYFGGGKSMMDDDTAPISSRSTPSYFGSSKEVKSLMDDDTAPLSVLSTSHSRDSGDDVSIVSDVTPRVSNCIMPACRNVEDSDFDQQGLVSCVGKEVADTSNDLVELVEGCIFLDESLLFKADGFFSQDQVQSLQNTFQEVSTEFDAASTRVSSLVKDLTCNGNALVDESIVELGKKATRKKEKMPTINSEVVPNEPTIPSKSVKARGYHTPSQLKEPPKAPPRVGLLRKLLTRRNEVRFAPDAT